MKRILVIADDLTGAAEIAGIGLRHGLSTHICRLEPPQDVSAQLIVFDTDSRLLGEPTAATRLRDLLRRTDLSAFEYIYKKTDSALRGHIVAEVNVLLEESKRSRCVLVAQNPSRGRTIRDGVYYINNVPLHQTDFGKDADRRIQSSSVAELLSPAKTICVRDASTTEEVSAIATQLASSDLPAGGADFFEANLRAFGCTPNACDIKLPIPRPKLFICGSASESRMSFVDRMRAAGAIVFAMPDDVFQGNKQAAEAWNKQILAAISKQRSTVVYVPQAIDRDIAAQTRVRNTLASIVTHLNERCLIGTLFLEGGATAAAVCDAMKWHQLDVLGELSTGIVALNPKCEFVEQIVVKPGSYPWCERVMK